MKFEDLSGKKFNYLYVEFRTENKNKHTMFHCLCDCGNKKDVQSDHLKSGFVKSCGCLKRKKGDSHHSWKGYGEISGDFWDHIRRDYLKRNNKRSKRRLNIDFTIDIKYVWELFLLQDRKCAISGVSLTFGDGRKLKTVIKTASLDRIDSTKGYVPGNVQWVHKIINNMKQSLDQETFINFCRKVAKNWEI